VLKASSAPLAEQLLAIGRSHITSYEWDSRGKIEALHCRILSVNVRSFRMALRSLIDSDGGQTYPAVAVIHSTRRCCTVLLARAFRARVGRGRFGAMRRDSVIVPKRQFLTFCRTRRIGIPRAKRTLIMLECFETKLDRSSHGVPAKPER